MFAAITDLSRIDTTPGSEGPFAPPAEFAGGDSEYEAWLKGRWSRCPATRQFMFVTSRMMYGAHFAAVDVAGPYASGFKRGVRRLHDKLKSDADKARAELGRAR